MRDVVGHLLIEGGRVPEGGARSPGRPSMPTLRLGVIWPKLSPGTLSKAGSRDVDRLLPVVKTSRR
jgi:hypothetical protein